MYGEERRSQTPIPPPPTPSNPMLQNPVTPKSYPFLSQVRSPMSGRKN
jgi:hypothetical protein